MSENKQVVFQVVPRPGERVWARRYITVQERDRIEGGLFVPGVTKEESPDQLGRYIIPASDPYHERRVAVMKQSAERENARSGFTRIVGPFNDLVEAANAVHAARPKSAEEVATEERSERKRISAKNAELQDKIAKLEDQLEAKKKKDF